MAKVLVIDDDSMNQRMADFILKKGNHETRLAGSGQQGIEMMLQEKPDVLLLDIEMPDMNGFETLEKIRSTEGIQDTKVIFLTGTVDEHVKEEAARLNVAAIVEKPFKAPELLGAI